MSKSKRVDSFTFNAESVQGVEGATITSKSVLRGDWKLYATDAEHGDGWYVELHVISWKGIVDSNGNELPSPADEPGILDALYMHETGEIARLISQGPNGPDALKN